MLWQSSGKMSAAIRLLTGSELCSHVEATLNRRVSLVCSTCGKNIALHLFVPILSYLPQHRAFRHEKMDSISAGIVALFLEARTLRVESHTTEFEWKRIGFCLHLVADFPSSTASLLVSGVSISFSDPSSVGGAVSKSDHGAAIGVRFVLMTFRHQVCSVLLCV